MTKQTFRRFPEVADLDTRDAAAAYLNSGFSVFPIPYGRKNPAGSWTTPYGETSPTGKRGILARSIDDLAAFAETDNIGLPAGLNGLLVVDIDTVEAAPAALLDALHAHPTATSDTRPGRDEYRRHHVYACPEALDYLQSQDGFPATGWGEIRTAGYIVVTPSTVDAGTATEHGYEWLSHEVAPLPPMIRSWLLPAGPRHGAAAIGDLETWAQQYTSATHPDTLATDLAEFAAAIDRANPARLNRADALKSLGWPMLSRSILGRYPAPDVVDGLLSALGDDPRGELRGMLTNLAGIAQSHHDADPVAYRREYDPTAPKFHVVPRSNKFAELALNRGELANLPPPQPLIVGTLDCDTTALLAGYHGTGKSFIALDWAACIASGSPWQGRETRQGRVCYIVGEGARGIDDRLTAWETYNETAIPPSNLFVIPQAVQLTADAEELTAYVSAKEFALVVVDTLARSAVGLDENSARDMGTFIAAADQIRRSSPDTTVLLVHHTGKDKSTVRGSSSLEAAMDTVYTVSRGNDGTDIWLKRTKRKDGPLEDLHRLDLVSVANSCVLDVPPPPEARDPFLQDAYDAIAITHGMHHATQSAMVSTVMEVCALKKSAAYSRISALRDMHILKWINPGEKTVYLAVDYRQVKRHKWPITTPPILVPGSRQDADGELAELKEP